MCLSLLSDRTLPQVGIASLETLECVQLRLLFVEFCDVMDPGISALLNFLIGFGEERVLDEKLINVPPLFFILV